jgi:hypothetical protein
MVEQDGTFRMNYIPEAQYLLRATGATDKDHGSAPAGPANPLSDMLSQSKVLKTYGDAELLITVKGESTGLSLQVPDAKSASGATGGSGDPGK